MGLDTGLIEEIPQSEDLSARVFQTRYLHTPRNVPPYTPEKRLMLEVLWYAVVEFKSYVDKRKIGKRSFQELEEWFNQEDGGEWPCSFENICSTLGLDSDNIRSGLKKYETRAQGRMMQTSKTAEYRSILRKSTY